MTACSAVAAAAAVGPACCCLAGDVPSADYRPAACRPSPYSHLAACQQYRPHCPASYRCRPALKSKLKCEQSKDKSHNKNSTNLVRRSEVRFSQSQSNLQVRLCSRPVSLVSPFFAQLQLLTGETKNC